jgi:hypothetical protein
VHEAGLLLRRRSALNHLIGMMRSLPMQRYFAAMAVAVHIATQNMSKSDYERIIGDLEASGDGQPEGRRFHAAYGADEVHMFEVWDSEEQFQAHGEQFFAALQGAGVDAGIVSFGPLHSEIPD